MTVAIWMGHSGSEKGAKGIVLEDDITRQARTWAVAYARAHGVSVLTDNDDMVLKQRIKSSNQHKLVGLIEFHCNFLGNGKASGAEVWYSKSRKTAPAFAKAVTKVFSKFGYKNRGAKPSSADRYGRLGILDDTNAPGLLVELFFVDNADDVARWRKNGKAYVEAITDAWLKAIGVNTTGKATPSVAPVKPKPKSTGKRIVQKGIWTALTTVMVRSAPSKEATSVAKYYKGESVKYDSYIDAEGIRWCSYIGASGKRRYVARRTLDNKHIYADCK